MSPSPRPHSWISTSAIRTPRGSAAPMKTPTAYCASTLLKAPTYRCFPLTTSTMSRPSSTTDPAKPWAGKHPPKPSMNYSPTRSNHPLLHRPLETAGSFRPTSRHSRELAGVAVRRVIRRALDCVAGHLARPVWVGGRRYGRARCHATGNVRATAHRDVAPVCAGTHIGVRHRRHSHGHCRHRHGRHDRSYRFLHRTPLLSVPLILAHIALAANRRFAGLTGVGRFVRKPRTAFVASGLTWP